MNRFLAFLLFLSAICPALFGQQTTASIKKIPPAGVELGDNDREELGTNLRELGKDIDALRARKDAFITGLLPDVMIYYKAVDYALRYDEFFSNKDIADGKKLLQEGLERVKNLSKKKHPGRPSMAKYCAAIFQRLMGRCSLMG